jgi:hypothetical protein
MSKLSTQQLRDVSEGIIQKVDTSIVPLNSVAMAVNLVFDDVLGRAVLRKDRQQIGDQIIDGKNCLGLFQHVTTAGVKVPVAVFNDSGDGTAVLSKYTSNAWSSAKTGLTAGAKMRFDTLLDTTVAVNGTDAISSADGESWVTTGGNLDVGNMPKGTMVREWQDKVFTAGVSANPDRLYFSSTPTAGVVSWTVGNGYIDIEPEDGAGGITALNKVPGYFLIFKERSLKRWDGSSTYPESLVTIGTPSQEAVIQTKQSCFYYNKRGIYETTGGYPRKISRRIQEVIEAIPASYYSSVSGWGDGERLFFSIGDITWRDINLTNVVIMYNIDSQNWAVLSFPTEFKRWNNFIDANGDEIIMSGDDDGNVWKVFNVDAQSDIDWMIQYQVQEFGSRGRTKKIAKIVPFTENVRNGRVSIRANKKGEFQPFGKNPTINSEVQEIIGDVSGRYFEIRVQGKGRRAEIIGADFPEIDVNLNYGN